MSGMKLGRPVALSLVNFYFYSALVNRCFDEYVFPKCNSLYMKMKLGNRSGLILITERTIVVTGKSFLTVLEYSTS
jgi:hypothetical protein